MTDIYSNFPARFNEKYDIREWGHALAILKYEFEEQFSDICNVLDEFQLLRSGIEAAGGGKSKISDKLDKRLIDFGWEEKAFDTSIHIDGVAHETPTHKVDCVKGRVALDVEWNNKTEFFDRDLNNFRLLHSLKAISVGVIITRTTELQKQVFNPLGKGTKYGASTTHLNKLVPKIEGGGAGGCPILVCAVKPGAYLDDSAQ
ncbi:BglII/BstYI family type II restriction endonuclease [Pseudovibrio sp. WM33]|uniref:BglII/BstYI family type II restriction endonuclease n=1 Tax=Pseudovibrio sp. WM33 TaxID=1735585 RepID=UPI0007AE9B8F|nr:BglII/BstYI family type II restriction endonuclease [Pseudovibrio sp. WM33]KZL17605.1 Restriction endonuclease BglII [Pseudovibrio sp. WM33]